MDFAKDKFEPVFIFVRMKMAAIPLAVFQPFFNELKPLLGAVVHEALPDTRHKLLPRQIIEWTGMRKHYFNAPFFSF